ncbi:hypothetical protein IKG02_00520 [Candidatus Saccharibacteria bacterium]|nr:hypothetical protein [Candidatus Saccharibacteria bacterium]
MEQNTTATTPVMNSGEQKNGKGWKVATTIALVVAVCGVGFGIYGMLQSSQKDNQISDLKVQVEDSNGKITSLETEKIETTDKNGATVTIADSVMSNLGFMVNYKDIPMELVPASYGKNKYYLYPDGKVIVRHDWTRYNDTDLPTDQRKEDDLTSRFNSKVIDLAEGHLRNGAISTLFFLQDDGKVAWIHDLELVKDSNQPIAYIEDTQEIAHLYGNYYNNYGNYYNKDIAGFVRSKSGEIYAIKPVFEDGYVVKYILD